MELQIWSTSLKVRKLNLIFTDLASEEEKEGVDYSMITVIEKSEGKYSGRKMNLSTLEEFARNNSDDEIQTYRISNPSTTSVSNCNTPVIQR